MKENINIEDIYKIIKDGSMAPSGENAQPWRFVVDIKKNEVHIFNKPEVDQSLYNFKQRGSYVAHGALIQNIVISSLKYGYHTNVALFPDKDNTNLVATIVLSHTAKQEDSLYEYIKKRNTNRKPHKDKKLSVEQKNEIINIASDLDYGEIKIVDDQESMNILGDALAVNELVLFSNKELHNFFYSHILWKEDEQEKAGGFYIKTLEFLPHQLKAVKLFKNWFLLKLFNKLIKISNKIAKENAEKYAKSGALVAIIANENTNQAFVRAGMLMQRVWLKATELGLSVHPCTGVLFFMERIKGEDDKSFSNEHIDIIKNAYNNITKIFNTNNRAIPMLFRIGYADAPTARSLRQKPDIIIEGVR